MRSTFLSSCLAFCLISNFLQSAPLPQSQSITPEEKAESAPEESSNGRLTDAIVPLDEIDESVAETIGDVAAGLRNGVGVGQIKQGLETDGQQEQGKEAEDGEREEQEAEEGQIELLEAQEEVKEQPQTEEAREDVKEEPAIKEGAQDEEVKDEAEGEEDNEHKEEVGEDEAKPQLRQGEAAKNVDDKSLGNRENFEGSEAGEENATGETKNEPEGDEFIEIRPNEENENKSEEEREIKLVKRSKRSAQSSELTNSSDRVLNELEQEGQSSDGLEPIHEELESVQIEVEDGKFEPDGDQLVNLPNEDRSEHKMVEERKEDIQAENSEE